LKDVAMEKTCLITGGAGFIGANLVRLLVARGKKIRVLDNLSTGRNYYRGY
jgi:UDP-glucose 4-epimerase